jgi:hypothetical protein
MQLQQSDVVKLADVLMERLHDSDVPTRDNDLYSWFFNILWARAKRLLNNDIFPPFLVMNFSRKPLGFRYFEVR